jgi:hypothetical protein
MPGAGPALAAGPHDQVLLGRHARHVGGAVDGAVGAYVEVQRVAVVDQLEDGLQQVVAVRAPARHVQEQVQLGRGRAAVQRCHGHVSLPG